MDDRSRKVLSKLQAQCARREYCLSDIREKVRKALDSEDEASDVLDALLKDGFVSDARYASAFAREKASISGWGPVKIRYALSAKRISREIIDSALEAVDENTADSRLRRLLDTKWKSLTSGCRTAPEDAKLKLIRFALGRGYSYEQLQPLLKEYQAI